MAIMRRLVSLIAKRKQKEIDHILNHPIEVMEDKLFSILQTHKDTVLGREYGFSDISSVEKFREQVPISDGQSMKRFLEMTYENPAGQVMTVDPVIWYLQTSGTTGQPKRLPITESSLKDVSKGSMLTLMRFMSAQPDNPKIVDGKLITFGAPAVLEHVNGIPVGYATGVYAQHQNPVFQRLIAPGDEIFNLTDMEKKMWEYAKLTATSPVTAIMGITTLNLALVRRMQDLYGPELAREFAGTKAGARINAALNDDGTLNLRELWPDLKLFVASGIDTDPYREWISKTFPDITIWEMYGGSEGFYGGQMFEEPGVQLSPNLNYFEFIPESEVESPEPTVIRLSDVKKGGRYEMLITNLGGWTRYRLGDLMTFTSTDPYTVRKIGRKGRVVNLSGEKVSEAHVSHAIETACAKTGCKIMDYTVVGEVIDGIANYTIAAMFRDPLTDSLEFVAAFEEALGQSNMEFRFNRETGALGPTRLVIMRTSYFESVLKETHVQAKPVPLTTDTSVLAFCEEAEA